MDNIRSFETIINEWTDTLVDANKEAQSIETVALLLRIGMLGQKLIYEANNIGMESATNMLREANDEHTGV